MLALVCLIVIVTLLFGSGGHTRYALTDSPVYAEPAASSAQSGALAQGEVVEVEADANAGWFMIVGGKLAGDYVPARAIGAEKPLALDRASAGEVRVRKALLLVQAPDLASPLVARLGRGKRVAMIGKVVGAEADNWYQFAFAGADGLSVPAYGQLSAGVVVTPAARAPPSVALSSPTAETAQEPSETPTAQPFLDALDPCARLPQSFERLSCQDPGLRQSQRQLEAAWQSANARMAMGGQSLPALRNSLAVAARCRTPRCARGAIAGEVTRLDAMVPRQANNVPPVETQYAPRPATPLGNPGSWVKANDYPTRAQRLEAQGTTGFRVTVGLDGRVSDCQVTASSGSADLDDATCQAVRRRARFNPATDSSGSPAIGSYANRVAWVLP